MATATNITCPPSSGSLAAAIAAFEEHFSTETPDDDSLEAWGARSDQLWHDVETTAPLTLQDAVAGLAYLERRIATSGALVKDDEDMAVLRNCLTFLSARNG